MYGCMDGCMYVCMYVCLCIDRCWMLRCSTSLVLAQTLATMLLESFLVHAQRVDVTLHDAPSFVHAQTVDATLKGVISSSLLLP